MKAYRSFFKKNAFWLSLLVCLVLIYFARLWLPTHSFIITPEFGSSDITHFNIPLKFFLSDSLKSDALPLWNKDMGNGYPIFAESQIGALFIVNLIFFRFLPFSVAFNLGYIISFVTLIVGFYTLFRILKLSPPAAAFAAFSISFSGFFILHINHYNILSAASVMPWILSSIILTIRKKSLTLFLISILLISQQFFAGFVQLSFITFLITLVFIAIDVEKKDRLFKASLAVVLIYLLGFVASAVQLYPSLELATLSTRAGGFNFLTAAFYSFPLIHLRSFIDPFFFGKVSNGTYKLASLIPGSIYWENTAYMGLVTMVFLFLSLIRVIQSRKLLIGLIGILVGILLALGKNSPLYFLYSFFPFSFFSTPSRYILITIICGGYLAGWGIDLIIKSKRIYLHTLIFLVLVADIFFHWFFYHPVVPVKSLLSPPKTASFLSSVNKPDAKGRIISINQNNQWSTFFNKKGWDETSPYLYFLNSLAPNTNLLWKISSHDIYVGRAWIRRSVAYDGLLNAGFLWDGKKLYISSQSAKLLDMSSVGYIVSNDQIIDKKSNAIFLTQGLTKKKAFLPYFVYQRPSSLDRARMVGSFRIAKTLEQINAIVKDPNFDPRDQVILEGDIGFKPSKLDARAKITIVEDIQQRLTLKAAVSTNAILVLSDTYYPGWKAYIDGAETKIFPANLSQRAILVARGRHTIIFSYEPLSFKIGGYITLINYIIIFFLLVFRGHVASFLKFLRNK